MNHLLVALGPSTESDEQIIALVEAGMTMVRLNSVHNTKAWHAQAIQRLRRLVPHIPIVLDLPGRKVRLRELPETLVVKSGKYFPIPGGLDRQVVDFLHPFMKTGHRLSLDDGRQTMRVTHVKTDGVVWCQAITDCIFRSQMGFGIPGFIGSPGVLTASDQDWLRFACLHGVDFVGLSYTEDAEHVRQLRKALLASPKMTPAMDGSLLEITGFGIPRIMAKIEHPGGVEHRDEISQEADVILIDRGDLTIECPSQSVASLQQHIIASAKRANKPVLIASRLLNSMIYRTPADPADIRETILALLDGADGVVLSGETAIGRYPVESVRVLRTILDYLEIFYKSVGACRA